VASFPTLTVSGEALPDLRRLAALRTPKNCWQAVELNGGYYQLQYQIIFPPPFGPPGAPSQFRHPASLAGEGSR
jgi:hypothetical protein